MTAALDDAASRSLVGRPGCAMLRERAAPAQAALRRRLDDPSGAVQVAAAEALARMGQADARAGAGALVGETDDPPLALQAANVLDRLGPIASPRCRR